MLLILIAQILAVSAQVLLIGDADNSLVRQLNLATRFVSTVAGNRLCNSCANSDGIALGSDLYDPNLLAPNPVQNNGVVVASPAGNVIRFLNNGLLTTLAGSNTAGYADGPGSSALFSFPVGVSVDNNGVIFVGDTNNNRIRKLTPTSSGATTYTVTTLAGSGTGAHVDGTGTLASFNGPRGILITGSTLETLLIADRSNGVIRSLNTGNGIVTTLCGSGTLGWQDGDCSSAQFKGPKDVIYGATDDIVIVVDYDGNRVRSINLTSSTVSTIAGSGSAGYADGVGTVAEFNQPGSGALDPATNILYVTDQSNYIIRQIDLSSKLVTVAAGSQGQVGLVDGAATGASFNQPVGIILMPNAVTGAPTTPAPTAPTTPFPTHVPTAAPTSEGYSVQIGLGIWMAIVTVVLMCL